MKLIDKDALVAEIERLVSNGKLKCQQSKENNDQVSYIVWSEHIATCGKILSFLDTIEVKKVDLEKENIIGTIEREVKIDAGGYPYINCDIEFYDYDKDIPLAKEGDKVKVIIVKGE